MQSVGVLRGHATNIEFQSFAKRIGKVDAPADAATIVVGVPGASMSAKKSPLVASVWPEPFDALK